MYMELVTFLSFTAQCPHDHPELPYCKKILYCSDLSQRFLYQDMLALSTRSGAQRIFEGAVLKTKTKNVIK